MPGQSVNGRQLRTLFCTFQTAERHFQAGTKAAWGSGPYYLFHAMHVPTQALSIVQQSGCVLSSFINEDANAAADRRPPGTLTVAMGNAIAEGDKPIALPGTSITLACGHGAMAETDYTARSPGRLFVPAWNSAARAV